MIFGLTGGIGVGKSTVAKFFNQAGVPTVDADQVARDVVVPGSSGLALVVEAFGAEILLEDGSLNRALLGERVFSSVQARLQLGLIMGPLIQQEGTRQLEKLRDEGAAMVGWDAALICEMGNADKYRPLVVVACPAETQVQRLIKRNGLTREQALSRIGAQMSTADKVQLADFVIDTSGELEATQQQVSTIIQQMHGLLRQSKQQEK